MIKFINLLAKVKRGLIFNRITKLQFKTKECNYPIVSLLNQ